MNFRTRTRASAAMGEATFKRGHWGDPATGVHRPPERQDSPLVAGLDIEAEFDHVAVLHDVVLAFDAGLADGAGGGY